MYSANFEYYRPTTLQEAISLLQNNSGSRILAGGHSLLPAMKLRVSMPSALVDISRIAELSGIQVGDASLRIGAMTTHATIAASDEVASACPIVAETAAQIGDQQVRNRGTIGGSLSHADPASDFPTVMVALDATLTAMGPGGGRDIPAGQFFTGLFSTALMPGEVLTSITVPVTGMPGMGSAYLKHRHPASNYAVVGVAALIRLAGGQIADASLAVGGVMPNPFRAATAEDALRGQTPGEDTLAAAAARIAEAVSDPMGDLYASGEYRIHLATVMARRALMQAADRAMA